MRKIILWILCCVGLIGTVRSQNTQTFSLSEAVSYAERESASLRSAELNKAYARAQVKDYTAIGTPKVSGSVDYRYNIQLPTSLVPANTFNPMAPEDEYLKLKFGTNHNLNLTITASTLVFDGSYFVGLKAAKGLVQMNDVQYDLTKHDIKYGVKSAYMTVLLIKENSAVLQKNIDNLSKIIEETKAYYKSGMVEQLDIDRLELSRSNLLSEMDIVARQTALAVNALKYQMNYPLQDSLVLTDSLPALMQEASLEDLNGEISYSGRMEVKVLEQSEYLNELNIRRYKMQYVPNMTAFITHQQQLMRNDLFDSDAPGFFPATIAGVSLNVPIFDGLATAAKIQLAKIDKDRISLQIKEVKRGISLETLNARTNYINAKERLDNQDSNLALAEKIIATTKIKYREGIGSSLEITQAEQELYRTQAAQMNALYDFLVAKNALDKALGK